MENKYLEKSLFIFFSIIPLSIILGPAISLINILIVNVLFLFFLYIFKDFRFLNNKIVIFLFILNIYLIFNSVISIDPMIGIKRNLGFLRFILLFIAFNYFFYSSKDPKKIFLWWFIILLIFTLDVYIEFITGSNILGFGDEKKFVPRIVSFFKDEPIAGAYLLGFFLIIIGYLFDNFDKKNNLNKFIIYFLSFLFLFSIIVTGERSNAIKAIGTFIVFFSINHFVKIKAKFLFAVIFVTLISFTFIYSDFLKYRFNETFLKQFTSKEKIIKIYEKSIYAALYKVGYQVFKKYPYFGVGNKNFRVETCNSLGGSYVWDSTEPDITYLYQLCSTHPHQIYFEFLAEHGIVGTIILLSILFFLIFRLLKIIIISKNYLQLGCLLYLIFVFTPLLPGGSFFNDFNATIFWINFSLLYASNKETNIFN